MPVGEKQSVGCANDAVFAFQGWGFVLTISECSTQLSKSLFSIGFRWLSSSWDAVSGLRWVYVTNFATLLSQMGCWDSGFGVGFHTACSVRVRTHQELQVSFPGIQDLVLFRFLFTFCCTHLSSGFSLRLSSNLASRQYRMSFLCLMWLMCGAFPCNFVWSKYRSVCPCLACEVLIRVK